MVDGGWENANDGILGADNKAAVAVILEVARRAAVEGAPVGIELLFTVAEENGARAAPRHFDAGRLRSEFGYVFDHATPIGEVVTASPTYFRDRRRVPRPRRARRAAPRGRPQRRARRRAARSPRCRSGASTSETTANVGSVTGRRRLHQRRPRAREPARRGALARPRAGRGRRGAHDRRDQRRRRRRGVRRRRHQPSACSRATARSRPRRPSWPPRRRCAPAATSRAGSPPAAGRTPTRSSATASRA